MKKITLILSAALLLSSCTYRQFDTISTGAGLGGFFGSAIGGLAGGPRGHDAGAVVGILAGTVAGAAVVSAAENNRNQSYSSSSKRAAGINSRDNTVNYSPYPDYQYGNYSQLCDLEVQNVQFMDGNENRALDSGESAYITFEIYNRGSETVYDVQPFVTCSSKKVSVSPAITINYIEPGQGYRYKAAVVAGKRLPNGTAQFAVTFKGRSGDYVAKTFSINTRRVHR